MARPRSSDLNSQTGLLNETFTAEDAQGYIRKQLDDLEFARTRLIEISESLNKVAPSLAGFVIEPTNYMRVCMGLKLTLKL